MPTQSSAPTDRIGPWSAPRDPRSYPSARKALLPDRQQDWPYAKAQYEAGIKTIQLIAAEIGVGPTAVYARASNEGWTKNPEARAQHIAELRVAADLEEGKKLDIERERATRVNAEMQARMLVQHRADIGRSRDITQRLWEKIQSMMDNEVDLDDLGDIMRSENERGQGRQNDLYRSIIALPGMVDMVKKLSDAMKTQLQLERQAFGVSGVLEDPEVPDAPRAGESEISKILGKFDLVLKAKSGQDGGRAVLGEVIDVPAVNR